MRQRCALLLRGVNLGARNRLGMADLRRVVKELGHDDAITYLQSGNVVLTTDATQVGELLEEALRRELGLSVRVFVRTAEELQRVIAANPFPSRVSATKLLHVAFLDEPPDPAALERIGLRHGDDRIALGERELYLDYTVNVHQSPLSQPLSRLKLPMTMRNWATVTAVTKLAAS
ncbi:MAG: DUF1697 domain-containing protein [Candidatus Dormibacteraeota bacterium]|uniref:DUF1697 domain-containing protein n=1 Tax=Candidatus Dormiibacter inghamiae TaxID=3127013 RepID=A0A934K6E4_9BACT|nr:DUF1697 domain-containing protein [Candidatus Dormibacteraeota bacterium]MBJ7605980.1 DUF1697 domain-containing protein [Candidatus Dormibacteraeota bacterium]